MTDIVSEDVTVIILPMTVGSAWEFPLEFNGKVLEGPDVDPVGTGVLLLLFVECGASLLNSLDEPDQMMLVIAPKSLFIVNCLLGKSLEDIWRGNMRLDFN